MASKTLSLIDYGLLGGGTLLAFLVKQKSFSVTIVAIWLGISALYFLWHGLQWSRRNGKQFLETGAYFILAIVAGAAAAGLYTPSKTLKIATGLGLFFYMVYFYFKYRIRPQATATYDTYRHIMGLFFIGLVLVNVVF